MHAYFYDENGQDQRLPHELQPSVSVSAEELADIGVLSWQLKGEDALDRIEDVCRERNYKNRDEITVSREGLGEAYEAKIKMFFEEHIHEDEEIRFILDGTGYFDVRDAQDRWIRIAVEKGDLLILPAGIYHRFTVDTNNYIKAMRLFKDDPVWTPINRPADANRFRQEYLSSIKA
ncbi:uncharacterized protein VTP21DRAFT_5900 [Calcarisporiella thermophila]|uniref:uncharacterized protein n=1 Tax=Calcarisporiella thermophila TaxID=911321 RepID=UPI00374435BF